MQIGFYFDQTRCTGCCACQVACKDWNDIQAGPEKWMRVAYREQGRYPTPFVSYMIATCWHCHQPVCAEACPTNAITKREKDGIVVVDGNACLGNEDCNVKCLQACPYDAPQFGPRKGSKMRKCDFCLERFEQNKLPACVEACPVRALDAGPLDALQGRHAGSGEAVGFKYSKRSRPAVMIKAKPEKLVNRHAGRPAFSDALFAVGASKGWSSGE